MRTVLTVAGIATSMAAIVFAYGISAWVEVLSSRSLDYVVAGSSIWVVPREKVGVDRYTGLIVPNGSISAQTVRALASIDASVHLDRVDAAPVTFAGRHAVGYGDERLADGTGADVSTDLWKAIGGRAQRVDVNGKAVLARRELKTLPARSFQMPLTEFRNTFGTRGGAAWLLADVADPGRWAAAASALPGIRATSDPASGVRAPKATVYLLHGSLARFDPFTFRTKFSALTLNQGMSNLFGVVARAVLLLGLILATTSAVFGVRERREEVALFAVSGLLASFTVLLAIEACLMQALSFVCGAAIGIALLFVALASASGPQIVLQSLAFGLIYVPVVIVVTTIVPAQTIAARKTMELVRLDV